MHTNSNSTTPCQRAPRQQTNDWQTTSQGPTQHNLQQKGTGSSGKLSRKPIPSPWITSIPPTPKDKTANHHAPIPRILTWGCPVTYLLQVSTSEIPMAPKHSTHDRMVHHQICYVQIPLPWPTLNLKNDTQMDPNQNITWQFPNCHHQYPLSHLLDSPRNTHPPLLMWPPQPKQDLPDPTTPAK